MIPIKHCAVTLALHQLADGPGAALLLLHSLRGSSAEWDIEELAWPGPVFALDFCGHGASDPIVGGSYSPELFVADADHALQRVGSAVVVGRGTGAYVALMLAGARPDLVPAALLLPGAGLVGGPPSPDLDRARPLISSVSQSSASGGDELVEIVEQLVRPPDYTTALATEARQLLLAEDGGERPPWWRALRTLPRVSTTSTDARAAMTALRSGVLGVPM